MNNVSAKINEMKNGGDNVKAAASSAAASAAKADDAIGATSEVKTADEGAAAAVAAAAAAGGVSNADINAAEATVEAKVIATAGATKYPDALKEELKDKSK